jgi:hypothetical protein
MPRPSTIEQLPPDLLARLQELLRDPRCTQLEVVARINALLEQRGEDERISKSALGRYAVKMERIGERLRQSRAVAEMWIGKLGAGPQGQLGRLINEMLRTLAFDLTLKLQEGEISTEDLPGTVESLRDLSLAVMRLEKAASDNIKREREIKQQAAEELAAKVEGETGGAGITPERLRQIVRETYGV